MGYGVGACTDYNKQVVVEHPVGQQNEIVAVGYVAVFMPYAQPGFSDNPSYYGLLGCVGTEDYAAADFIGKITQGKNPLGKTGFVLGFFRHEDNDACDCVKRYIAS